jgi:hypothetical protein
MIGESLSPTPRQLAEEILRRLAPVEREALLVKCWMSHDARRFMAAARECGMEVTSSPRWGPRSSCSWSCGAGGHAQESLTGPDGVP